MTAKEYTLTRVAITETKKDGTVMIDKNGKKFQRVGVQVAENVKIGEMETAGQWINSLWFDGSFPYDTNDKVVMNIFEEEYQGKKQLKFEIPQVENPNQKYFEEILGKLAKMNLSLTELVEDKRKREVGSGIAPPPKKEPLVDPTYPSPEQEGINLDDVPF